MKTLIEIFYPKKMKAYYARPITHYNTKEDKQTLRLLNEMGLEVEDPNQEKYQIGYKEKGMQIFLDAIDDCDVVFFKSFCNGKVTSGVQKEIQKAYDLGIPVFEFNPFLSSLRKLSVEETRKAIKRSVK